MNPFEHPLVKEIVEQRNQAFNNCATLTAHIRELTARIQELTAQLARVAETQKSEKADAAD